MIFGDPIRTVAPAALPVSLAELKAQARIDLTDEDALLMGYLRSATEMVEQYTGLALITQTWTQTFSAFVETNPTRNVPLKLWRRPLQAVTLVSYLQSAGSPAGVPAVLDPSIYRVLRVGSDITPGAIVLANGASWPTPLTDDEAITITYTAGFGPDGNSVPELIRLAILQAASTFYGYREDVIMGSTVAELPWASRNLLRSWRPLAVA